MKNEKYLRAQKRKAFALVLAIAAMAFMVLLVLTLSSVITSKLRLLNAQKEQRQARSNALLGMSVALSQLQRTMGPDNAISFPATIFDTEVDTPSIEGVQSPYVFGGYKIPINENSRKSFKDVQDELLNVFEPIKKGGGALDENVNWFVSSQKRITNPVVENVRDLSAENIKLASYKSLSDYPSEMGGYVNSGLKSESVEVYAGKVPVESGSYAWWVSDESTKAKLNLHRPDTYLDGETTGSASSYEGPSDTRIPQISYVGFVDELSNMQLNPFLDGYNDEDTTQLQKMSSLDEFAILDSEIGNWSKDNKGDYTMVSYGVPVDVTQGRLKEDLTVYLEMGIGPRDTDPIIRGHERDDDYIGPTFGISSYDQNIPRMGMLKDYATMARQTSGKVATFDSAAKPSARKETTTEATHGLYPIVHTVTYAFQPVYSGSVGSDISVYLMFYPRVFLWNPHHVKLEKSDYVLRLFMPYFFEIGARGEKLGASPKNNYYPDDPHWGEDCALMAVYDYTYIVDDETKPSESLIYFHPQMYYNVNGGGRGSFRKNFHEFLPSKSLRRGEAPVASGKGNLPGYPVINMKIEGLALNPGETIELSARGQAGSTYNDTGTGTDGILRSSSYPKLISGTLVDSSGKMEPNSGIKLDPKISLSAKHPDDLVGAERRKYRAGVAESKNGRIIGNWRVCPVLEEANMPQTPKEDFGSFPCPGYELWLDGDNGLEMLVSLDMGKVESGGNKTVVDENTGWRNRDSRRYKTGDFNYDSGYGQHEIFPAMYGVRFSNAYAWDNQLSTVTKGSYYESGNPGNWGWHYRVKNVQSQGGDLIDPNMTSNLSWESDSNGNDVFKNIKFFNLRMTGGTTPNYSVEFERGRKNSDQKFGTMSRPEIPEMTQFLGSSWKPSDRKFGVSYFLLKETGDSSKGYQTQVGTNRRFGYKLWERTESTVFDLIADHPHANVPIWTIATIIPSKSNAKSGFVRLEGDGNYIMRNPAFFAVTNYLRDNGSASRVNANHGYLAPIQDGNWGGGQNQVRDYIFKQDPSDTNVGRIDVKSSYSKSADWGYLSRYSTAGDQHSDRYGTAVLWKARISYMQDEDMGYVQPVFDYPRFKEDLLSLGVFHQANLSMMWWQPTFVFGESYPSPFIKREEIINNSDKVLHQNELIDISYMLNASMWDRFYLSSMPQDGSSKPFAGMRLLNTRHVLSTLPTELRDLYGTEEAYKKSAAYVLAEGPFNVNSTSYEAWRAFLGGMLGVKKKSILEDEYPKKITPGEPKEFFMPNPGNLNVVIGPQPEDQKYGYRDAAVGRNISEADLDELIREIIAEVKRRAPFFSLSDFVNRRLISYADSMSDDNKKYQGLMGTISAAIHRTQENHLKNQPNVFNMYQEHNKVNNHGDIRYSVGKTDDEYIEHAKQGPKDDTYMHLRGMPGVLKQSQILNAIAPFITVRGDTYTIRSFGEYKNPMSGTTSRAYCEAVVQRGAEPVEATDDIVAPEGPFGRKFKVVSFRWLTPAEL